MKVLTALTLLPRLSPDLVYTARRADEDIDGSKVGVVAGSTYTVQQLFLGMMLSSGNDAANALANAAGGVPTTVALMQQEASALGARDTVVRDPSGLDSPGQGSSPYDLGLIARAAMQRADFRTLVSTKTAHFPGKLVKGKRTKGFQIQNHNELLAHYPGAIGVKTGYTVAARWTYIGAARRGGHTYLVTEQGLTQPGWRPAMKMLDWAFAHGTSAMPVGHLVNPGELAATTADDRDDRRDQPSIDRSQELRAGVGRRVDPRLPDDALGRHRRARGRSGHHREPRDLRRPSPTRLSRPRRTSLRSAPPGDCHERPGRAAYRCHAHCGRGPEHRAGRDRRAVGRARTEVRLQLDRVRHRAGAGGRPAAARRVSAGARSDPIAAQAAAIRVTRLIRFSTISSPRMIANDASKGFVELPTTP